VASDDVMILKVGSHNPSMRGIIVCLGYRKRRRKKTFNKIQLNAFTQEKYFKENIFNQPVLKLLDNITY